MMRTHLITLALLLVGCANLPKGEESPHNPVPVGSRLILQKPISIAADSVSVYLQTTGRKSNVGVNRYYPYCKFEMWTLAQEPRVVQPDTFQITRVERTFEYVGLSAPTRFAGLQLAGIGIGIGIGIDGGAPLARVMETELFLHSDQQPDVYRLTCARWDEPAFAEHLSIADIREALAGTFTLNVRSEG